jgi:hypothetical protein
MDACVARPPDVVLSADHHALCWLYADDGETGAVAGSTTAGKTGTAQG